MRFVGFALVAGVVAAGLISACNDPQDSLNARGGRPEQTDGGLEADSGGDGSINLQPARELYPTISALHERKNRRRHRPPLCQRAWHPDGCS